MKQLYNIYWEDLDDDIIDYLKETCKKYGSENIIKFLEDKISDSIDMDRFNEKTIVRFFIIF